MGNITDIIWPIAVFVFVFIIYVVTLSPDLGFTDSGELAAVCATLGVAHPTGYPLFTILGHIWSKIPLPFTGIYSMNLLAALYTALSVMVFYNIVHLLLSNITFYVKSNTKLDTKKKTQKQKLSVKSLKSNSIQLTITSVAASLMYAFSSVVWSQAVVFEVYSLQLLLLNLVIYFFLKAYFEQNSQNSYLLLGALLLGLSFANHLTTILIVPGLFFIYFHNQNRYSFSKEKIVFVLYMLIPFAIGLSFYLYLPIRSTSFPDFNWGWVSRDIDKFLYHVLGKQYQVWMFTGMEAAKKNFDIFISAIPYQLAWIGFIPFLLGLYKLWQSSKSIFFFLATAITVALLYTLNYSIHDIDTYFLTVFIPMLLITAVGISRLIMLLKKAALVVLILPLMSLFINFQDNDHSNDYLVREYTRILTTNLAPDAIILSAQWDYWCSAFWYMQKVERWRPDIVLVEKELLRRTWYPEQFKRWHPEIYDLSKSEFEQFIEDLELFEAGKDYNPERIQARFTRLLNSIIERNIDDKPIYITSDILQTEPDVARDYEKIPEGFAIRLEKSRNVYPVNTNLIEIDKFIRSKRKNESHLEEGIRKLAAHNLTVLGRYAAVTGQNDKAKLAFEKALRLDPSNMAAMQGLDLLKEN